MRGHIRECFVEVYIDYQSKIVIYTKLPLKA